MADMPLVTVIVNCYNHATWLGECLDSVKAQTYRPVQLIVMDDCSTDESADLIRAWMFRTGTTCTFVANDKNCGLAATRNRGLRMATGSLVSWISTDDVWLPEKLERQVQAMLEAGPENAVVYSDAERIDTTGTGLDRTMLQMTLPEAMPPRGDVFDALVRRNFVPSLATLVRLDCLHAVGGYDERIPVEDWDLWLRLARRWHFAFSPYVSARVRIVPTSRWHSLSDAEWDETQLLISEKHIGYRRACDGLLRERMAEAAVRLWTGRHPDRDAFLRKAIRSGGPHRTVAALVGALRRELGRGRAGPAVRVAS